MFHCLTAASLFLNTMKDGKQPGGCMALATLQWMKWQCVPCHYYCAVGPACRLVKRLFSLSRVCWNSEWHSSLPLPVMQPLPPPLVRRLSRLLHTTGGGGDRENSPRSASALTTEILWQTIHTIWFQQEFHNTNVSCHITFYDTSCLAVVS